MPEPLEKIRRIGFLWLHAARHFNLRLKPPRCKYDRQSLGVRQTMQVRFIGCGDAFGSGGRFNTCFQVIADGLNLIIDCGASSTVALKRFAVDLNAVDAIVLTHFHGDHCGGLPFFMLDAQFVSRRPRPLVLAGPPGLSAWYERAMDLAFPGSRSNTARFRFSLVEVGAGRTMDIDGARLTPFPVVHDERAGPCLGYRAEIGGRVLAYSGDAEWTESLIDIGRDADLMICESFTPDKAITGHLSLSTLKENLPRIRPKRLVLTHMGDAMLAQLAQAWHPTAEDGIVVEV